MAATIPECMHQNIAQPHKKPAAGWKLSFRKTYTPPVRGNADASSAQMSAPNSVSTPANSQTSKIPETLGTRRVISDGWTNIEAPMMIPTTIAVARSRPMGRGLSVATMSFLYSTDKSVCATLVQKKSPICRALAACIDTEHTVQIRFFGNEPIAKAPNHHAMPAAELDIPRKASFDGDDVHL